MALLNEILVGRYNRLAQKLLSMKGPAALPQLSGELRFVLPVFHGTENRYLEGWDTFGRTLAPAAPGAGNSTFLSFRMPAGANAVAVFTAMPYIETAATNASLATTSTLQLVRGMTTDQNGLFGSAPSLDARGRKGPSLIISANTAATGAPGGTQISIAWGAAAALTTVQLLAAGQEIPIFPGDGLLIISGNTNTTLFANPFWRERFLEESERT